MAVLQVRVDDDLKNKACAIYDELGIDISTAVRMFLKRTVQIGGLPFDPKIDNDTLKAILAIDEMRTISEQSGNCNMTLDEINEEIRLSREERRKNG